MDIRFVACCLDAHLSQKIDDDNCSVRTYLKIYIVERGHQCQYTTAVREKA